MKNQLASVTKGYQFYKFKWIPNWETETLKKIHSLNVIILITDFIIAAAKHQQSGYLTFSFEKVQCH